MNTKINNTDQTQYRVTWTVIRPNPRFVRGRNHEDIISIRHSDIFSTIEEAQAFRVTINGETDLQIRKPGNKNFTFLSDSKV